MGSLAEVEDHHPGPLRRSGACRFQSFRGCRHASTISDNRAKAAKRDDISAEADNYATDGLTRRSAEDRGHVSQLVSTAAAARELGIAARTLQRWAADGLIQPDMVTIGGHARWDVSRLREAIREMGDERREGR